MLLEKHAEEIQHDDVERSSSRCKHHGMQGFVTIGFSAFSSVKLTLSV